MIDDDPYTSLFEQYKRELRSLYLRLVDGQSRAIKRIKDNEGVDDDEAIERLESEHGPLVHDGRAIYLIRRYWLEIRD